MRTIQHSLRQTLDRDVFRAVNRETLPDKLRNEIIEVYQRSVYQDGQRWFDLRAIPALEKTVVKTTKI